MTLYSAAPGLRIAQACYATGDRFQDLQEQGADFLLTVKTTRRCCITRSAASFRESVTSLFWATNREISHGCSIT